MEKTRMSEAFFTGASFTGEVKENEDGKPVAVFKGNGYGLAHGPLTGLALMFIKTNVTEAELVQNKFNNDSHGIHANEETDKALKAIKHYQPRK